MEERQKGEKEKKECQRLDKLKRTTENVIEEEKLEGSRELSLCLIKQNAVYMCGGCRYNATHS
jgi:hypothetical protein